MYLKKKKSFLKEIAGLQICKGIKNRQLVRLLYFLGGNLVFDFNKSSKNNNKSTKYIDRSLRVNSSEVKPARSDDDTETYS